jgi:hypothetical protein
MTLHQITLNNHFPKEVIEVWFLTMTNNVPCSHCQTHPYFTRLVAPSWNAFPHFSDTTGIETTSLRLTPEHTELHLRRSLQVWETTQFSRWCMY